MNSEIKYNVVDTKGKAAGDVTLDASVFGVEVDPGIMHQVVRWQLAKRRSGTHATKNLAKTDNNKKKPYKQKGTGRARAGSRYATNRVGGAVAHGPQPHGYDYKVNRKVKRAAVAGALTAKCQEKSLCIVKDLALTSPKTKEMQAMITVLKNNAKKVLVVISSTDACREKESQMTLAGRNIQNLKFIAVSGLNAYDVLNADCLVFDQACLPMISEKVLGVSEVAAA